MLYFGQFPQVIGVKDNNTHTLNKEMHNESKEIATLCLLICSLDVKMTPAPNCLFSATTISGHQH